MPLFKGKGCKSTPGKAIAYITDENKAEIVSSQNLDDNQDYAQQFRETADLYGKGEKFDERKYYHFKLSCDRADEVSAEAHHEFAEAMAALCVFRDHANVTNRGFTSDDYVTGLWFRSLYPLCKMFIIRVRWR